MLRGARVGVGTCGCHPQGCCSGDPQLLCQGAPPGAWLGPSFPSPSTTGPRDQALPEGFTQAAVTTQLSAMA